MKLASSPCMKSSTTTFAPAAPNWRCSSMPLERALGVRDRGRDDDALAGREAVGLDHDRRRARADVGAGAREVRERPIGRGRDPVARQELLGERLRALELRARRVRPEALEPLALEPVDDARDERRLGPDDREPDALRARERDEPVEVVGRDRRRCAPSPRARCPRCRARRAPRSRAATARTSRRARARARRRRSTSTFTSRPTGINAGSGACR